MPIRRRKALSPRTLPLDAIRDRILIVRGHKVLLDSDLATLYGLETRRLNEQVRRNPGVFLPIFSSS